MKRRRSTGRAPLAFLPCDVAAAGTFVHRQHGAHLIGGLKLFDVVAAMTNSGPGYASASLSTLMYQLYFGREDAGYASTIGILMFIIISVVSIAALILLRRREVSA
ncbi:hypothetical protein [Paenibacillus beijingensis]|uniref:hypothetical protein n=1 Tax=Paenibacillus beijingensis TaxID=1126833 RepID=UPI00268273E2